MFNHLSVLQQCDYSKNTCLTIYYQKPNFIDLFHINYTSTKKYQTQEYFPIEPLLIISIFFIIFSICLRFYCYRLRFNRPVQIYADFLAPYLSIIFIVILCTAWWWHWVFPRFPYPKEIVGMCIIKINKGEECMIFTENEKEAIREILNEVNALK